ncbi:MAG: hypothetical protein HC788_02380 [Sphingopyxis sp.]|nr:hypothetical protein [Sphingopyxis sp.]
MTDLQHLRSSADVYSQFHPRELQMEDTLAKIAGEEQRLRLVNHHVAER